MFYFIFEVYFGSLPRRSATATVRVIASTSAADMERKPSKLASTTSIQRSASWARGEKGLSVIETRGTCRAATDCAQTINCQVNPNMPRTHGDSYIHLRDVDYVLPYDEPLL